MNLTKKDLNFLKTVVNTAKENGHSVNHELLSKEASNAVKQHKFENDDGGDLFSKAKQVVSKFFSINEDWNWKRNLKGAFLVYLPEIPTYFIPSYTQSKKTGCAKDLKHGEGIRGLLTGMLEGVAVGAIVSGKDMKAGKIVPFALLGAAIQLMSSLTLPKVGEKVGTFVYNKRKYAEKLEEIIDIPFGNEPTPEQLKTLQKPQTPAQLTAPQKPQAPNTNQPQFKGAMPYNQFNRGSLRV